MATPFDETKIPAVDFDVDSLSTAATNLETKAGDLRTSGSDVKTKWAGIQNVYKAPEQETLYAAMDPVATDTDTLATALESMAGYLSTFAESMSGIKARAQTLRTNALAFKAKIKDNPEWDHDQDLVDENNGLITTANGIQVDMWDAERTCANSIRALDGLEGYHADPTGDDDELGYGYSDIPEGTEGMPWGSPVDRQDACPKKAGVAVKRFLWDGLVCEGLGGMVNGVLNLGGVEFEGSNGFTRDDDRRTATWRGLGMLIGLTWDEDGQFQGAQRETFGNAWKETAKGFLCWDVWEEDPARCLGGATFNLASVLIPGLGIATKVTSGASKAGRAARWAAVAGKVLNYMDPLGMVVDATLGKITKVVVSKVDLDFTGLDLPWQRGTTSGFPDVDVDARTDLPDVDVDVDGGHRNPRAHSDGTSQSPDLDGVDLGRSDVDAPGARRTPEVDAAPDAPDAPHARGGDGGDVPEGGRRPDADATPDGGRSPDGDVSPDGRSPEADTPDASQWTPDGDAAPDGGRGPAGEAPDGADSPDVKDSPDAGQRTPDYDPDKDAFNQEHRPSTERSVKVDADSPLAPKATKPFGKGVDLDPNTCYEVEGRGKYYTDDAGEIVHVEADSAVQRQTWLGRTSTTMNPDLKDPLPNATYTVDGKFHYTTDEWGRTVRLQVDRLDVVGPDGVYESKAAQRRIGHYGDGLGGGFQGGHLTGKRFGGPPEDINVVPMRESVNGNHPGSFYELEKKIADNPGDYRDIDIRIEYDGPPANADSVSRLGDVNPVDRVPTEFTVSWKEQNGLQEQKKFVNRE
ncbi:DNA/RNA non-specific endonuclease [Actinomyces ruminicola]|uniref:DNA/RNA non-specific endonuclease n=1 Tax=Actinomyces ruminicola TaxID=332524 RepID=A0A1H0EBU7_9ACTO|nr:DNA/RNA non-specific endonuclease [Actinomyces ruminicola]